MQEDTHIGAERFWAGSLLASDASPMNKFRKPWNNLPLFFPKTTSRKSFTPAFLRQLKVAKKVSAAIIRR